jgi:hypothetical protein
MVPDFFDLTYLSKGSAIQRHGFRAIVSSGILNLLKDFNPLVIGTLPLDLFADKSDIDIICCCDDPEKLCSIFHHCIKKNLSGVDSVIVNFEFDGFDFEIVGQPVPVTEQIAYRHMVVEWNILAANDDAFRGEIIRLKKSGMKTEPAFAQLLQLDGDPYQALLSYSL